MISKEQILSDAKDHVKKVVLNLEKSGKVTEKSFKHSKEIFKTLSAGDQIVEGRLMKYNKKRIGEIGYLKSSPYFVRCDVIWEN
jgi:hypothetical protein